MYITREVLIEKYGEEVGGWVDDELERAKVEVDDSCIDNERVAEVGNDKEEMEYDEAAGNGCCGSHDEIVTHESTGRQFKIGFNHGH